MKVLMLSTDKNALNANSEVRLRFVEYGKHFDELHILVLNTGMGEGKEEIAEGVWLYSTRSMMKALIPFDALSIGARIAKRNKVQVITTQDPFEVGEIGARIAKKVGAKLHVQVHTDPTSPWFIKNNPKNLARLGLMHRVLKRADAIRVVSERVKRGIKSKLIDVVEPSVLPIVHGLSATQPEKDKPRFPFTILCVGRLEKEKHWNTAIDVLKEAHKSFPGAGIIFVGEGTEKKRLEAYVRSKGLKDSVHFAGWSNKPHEWFGKAHCLLHTGAYEGYGRVLIEAALAKLPIVSTDVGVVGEVFRLGQDIFACPIDDVACLSAGVRELMNNTYLRETIPRQAYDQAVAHIAKYKNAAELFAKDIEQALTP
mgnify:FL=1|tara:strand:- start:27729 stop:28835 length:1107 start_codon:yes stop_codon:yes gene_type:complete